MARITPGESGEETNACRPHLQTTAGRMPDEAARHSFAGDADVAGEAFDRQKTNAAPDTQTAAGPQPTS